MRALCLLCALTFVAAPLRAQEATPEQSEEARKMFERGQQQLAKGLPDFALSSFEGAFDLTHASSLLFYIAEANRMAGHWREAETAYNKYMKYLPNGPKAAQARELAWACHVARRQGKAAEAPKVTEVPAAPHQKQALPDPFAQAAPLTPAEPRRPAKPVDAPPSMVDPTALSRPVEAESTVSLVHAANQPETPEAPAAESGQRLSAMDDPATLARKAEQRRQEEAARAQSSLAPPSLVPDAGADGKRAQAQVPAARQKPAEEEVPGATALAPLTPEEEAAVARAANGADSSGGAAASSVGANGAATEGGAAERGAAGSGAAERGAESAASGSAGVGAVAMTDPARELPQSAPQAAPREAPPPEEEKPAPPPVREPAKPAEGLLRVASADPAAKARVAPAAALPAPAGHEPNYVAERRTRALRLSGVALVLGGVGTGFWLDYRHTQQDTSKAPDPVRIKTSRTSAIVCWSIAGLALTSVVIDLAF